MKIHRVQIKNFRNFKDLDVLLGDHAVIVGENKIGKTNFLYALRLVLDPSLPDSARQLQESDFWDDLRPISKEDVITISVDLAEFEHDEDLMAILAEHLISPEPMIARLTYVYQPRPTLTEDPAADIDYEFFIYGGNNPENKIGYEIRRRIPLDVLPALRDAERDLLTWRASPLKPLLESAVRNIDRQELQDIAESVTEATEAVTEIDEIKNLTRRINYQLNEIVGSYHAVETVLGFSPTDPNRLVKALRLFIDGGLRAIGDASLGTANLLYLVLKLLELRQLVEQNIRSHTFLAIEEPEAHLHPHIQRLVYGNFLKTRNHQRVLDGDETRLLNKNHTILLTTHSPHIISVTPLRSLVLLRRAREGNCTEAVSTANIALDEHEIEDLERYLDVTRGEMLFAKGIILVEGDAEKYLVPVLGSLIGYNFDQLGITVCSVSGTNFLPYIKLLGENGLVIPYAILTDLDPLDDGTFLGHGRVIKLLSAIMKEEEYSRLNEQELVKRGPEYGIFLNNHTLEVELFLCGHHKSMCETLIELSGSNAAKKRAQVWLADPENFDKFQFLKDINMIGKGRYAQRLAARIKDAFCPGYIEEAIKYVAQRCR